MVGPEAAVAEANLVAKAEVVLWVEAVADFFFTRNVDRGDCTCDSLHCYRLRQCQQHQSNTSPAAAAAATSARLERARGSFASALLRSLSCDWEERSFSPLAVAVVDRWQACHRRRRL
jgi:hypothetical protein